MNDAKIKELLLLAADDYANDDDQETALALQQAAARLKDLTAERDATVARAAKAKRHDIKTSVTDAGMTPMSQDRQNAIRLMLSRGWQHSRSGNRHEFRRADTGGWWDLKRVSHGNLSLQWAITACDDEELARRVSDVREAWVREALAEIEKEPAK